MTTLIRLSVSVCAGPIVLNETDGCCRAGAALNEILEHGEKLASMVALRELNNTRAQPKSTSSTMFSQYNAGDLSGAVWDMIQLVGDKARRNNVVLMDRDKVEVFYTRVSELEELFVCIQQHAAFLVQRDQAVRVQIERACELAKACSTILQVAIAYRDAQQAWYPSPEGITPWYCKQNVRSGLWKVATMLLELKVEGDMSEPTLTAEVMRQVEEMTDFLLEGYAGAITAKVEREEEYRGLQMEYWTRRDRLLTALQQHAFQVAAQVVICPRNQHYSVPWGHLLHVIFHFNIRFLESCDLYRTLYPI
jgi:nuclear pore complex protein Nup133